MLSHLVYRVKRPQLLFFILFLKICVRGRAWFYLDGSTDPNNWLHHVQYARNTQEQNLEAFQLYGDIYFRITKPIKSGTELRVFYSQEYRKRVGFKADLGDLLVDQGKSYGEFCQMLAL